MEGDCEDTPSLVVCSPEADIGGAVIDDSSHNCGYQGIMLALAQGDE